MSGLYEGRGLRIVSGQGAEVFDDHGRIYVDFMTGHGSSLFGHCHPDLVSAAKDAADRPWSLGLGISSDSRSLFLDALRSIFPGGRAFMCNSGTEAIEAALKLVTARAHRPRILALRRGFHGRTMGSLSLTFNPKYRDPWASSLYPVEHLTTEELAASIDERTAAVFVEPIQGEGGVYPLDREMGKQISDACRKFEVPLVADEIQSGWGRCGSITASDLVGLEPDVVCFAKGVAGGLPIGALAWKNWLGDFPVAGHGTTYGGNPFVSSVAVVSRRLLEEKRYPALARQRGESFMDLLSGIKSPILKEVRGMGLLVGVETSIKSGDLVRELQVRGVLALSAGPRVLRFLPPFVAEDRHFHRVVDVLREVCDELGKS